MIQHKYAPDNLNPTGERYRRTYRPVVLYLTSVYSPLIPEGELILVHSSLTTDSFLFLGVIVGWFLSSGSR